MRADTHLMGSARGYGQLAASPGVTDAESATLGDIDIGQPAGGRAERLATHIVAVCRTLPTGRIALTRCVAGDLDDAGRPTIEFRSIVMDASKWVWPIRTGVGPLLRSNAFWGDSAFVQGKLIEWSVVEPAGDVLAADGAAVDRMVARGPRPVLFKSSTRHDAATLQFVASTSDVIARKLQWGLGLSRPCSGLDVATVAGGGGASQPLQLLRDTTVPSSPATILLASQSAPSRVGGAKPTRSMCWIAACAVIILGGGLWWALWESSPQPATSTPRDVPHRPVETGAEVIVPKAIPSLAPTTLAPKPHKVGDPSGSSPVNTDRPSSPIPTAALSDSDVPAVDVVVRTHPGELAPPAAVIDLPANPAAAFRLLDDWHHDVLSMLVPHDARPGGAVSGPILIRHAEDVLRPLMQADGQYEDGLEYLCALSDVMASLDDISAIVSANAIRHWGAVAASARWMNATGRNERMVRTRVKYLKLCVAELRKIKLAVAAIDNVIQHDVRMVLGEIDTRGLEVFVGSNSANLAFYESCLRPIREVILQDVNERWPVADSLHMLIESCDYLKPHRGGQPDGDQ